MKTITTRALFVLALVATVTQPAWCDSITGIRISQPSPSYLTFNQQVDITFDYTTDHVGGVRIFTRPFTMGALTPGYAANPSPLYPTGSGAGTGFFTITAGDATVDQIRFQVFNGDQSELLMEFFVDVEIHYGPHSISNIVLTPSDFASLSNGDNVTLSFDYATTESGGVRIFARPFTAGGLTPGYGAHGSSLHPVGSGTGDGFFTITSGDVTVDQIRLQMLNADQSTLLLELFVDVHYLYSAHSISNISVTPASPASLPLGSPTDRVEITFDYKTNDAGGVRIFPRPMTGTNLTSGYAASGSPLYATGTGNGSGNFTIQSGPAIVDGIRFQMYNADQSALLLEYIVPVDILFANNRVGNIAFEQESPGYFTHDERVNFTFDYSITEGGGGVIFGRPFTGGGLSPNYAAHPSPVYNGSGSSSGFFTITSDAVTVDQVRFQIANADQSSVLLNYFRPVEYHFLQPISNVAAEDETALPVAFALEQNYPNPFNPATTIPFAVSVPGRVSLTVYDTLGREVRTLVDDVLPAGRHEVRFDAGTLPSGMYLYRLQSASETLARTLVLMK